MTRRRTVRFKVQDKLVTPVEVSAEILKTLRQRAEELGLAPAQLALAWVLAQGEDVVPIPGSRRIANVTSNVRAAATPVDESAIAELSTAFPPGTAAGQRYPDAGMARVEQ